MPLTQKIVASRKYEGDGQSICTLWDSAEEIKDHDKKRPPVPGFGLRIYPSGKKTFVFKYKIGPPGRQMSRLKVIGGYGEMTLQNARTKAERARVALRDGNDPFGAQKATKGRLLGDLADDWLELHAKKYRRSWKEDERRIKYIKKALGKKLASEVSAADLTRLHTKVGKERGKTEANRAITLVRAIYGTKSRKLGLIPKEWNNPASDVQLYTEKKRTRIVRHDEFPRLMKAVQEYENPIVGGAVLMLLFTGLRKTDVLNMEWSDVDLGAGTVTLLSEKADEPRIVLLSEPARKILEALPRFEGNSYVFPGRKDGQPLNDIKRGWDAIRKAAGCSDLRLHDFKRTVGTMLAQRGENPFVIQKVLGHRDERTARYYVQLSLEMTSGVMDRFGADVEALANGDVKTLPGKTDDD